MISESITGFSTSCSTALRRDVILAGFIKGCSSHDFSIRLPIEVFVESMTHKRDPFFSLLRRVSVSSRFLLAVKPMVITGSTSCLIIFENLPTSAFCVWYIYANSPQTAFALTFWGSIPRSSRLFTENCFNTSSVWYFTEKSISSRSCTVVLSFSLINLESSLLDKKASLIRTSDGSNLESSLIASVVICFPENSKRWTSPVEMSAKHIELCLSMV